MNNLKGIKLKSIITLLFIAIACFSSLLFLSNNGNYYVKADMVVITDSVFLDEYNLNSEVDFPSEIEIDYKGQTVTAANGVMVYPDGSVIYAGFAKLDKLGDYTVRYYFDDQSGNKCVAEKNFKVTNKLYSVSTLNGSVTAVTAEDQQDKTFADNDTNVMYNKEDGIIVRLAEGDTFNFTTSIDLTEVGEDGLCDIISLDYRNVNFVPNTDPVYKDEADARDSWKKFKVDANIATYCIIRLSDSYDLGNYVELYCRFVCPENSSSDINNIDTAKKSNYYPNFSACAVGQIRTALAEPNPGHNATYFNITLDGEEYGLYYKNEKGGRRFSNVPMTGDHTAFTWKYDYKTNKIYVQQGDKIAIVSALSSSEIYGTDTFDGFSSGKVKLSIYMSDYVSGDQGRIDVTSIGKYSGAELVENYGKLGFVDDVAAPVINVGVKDTDSRGIYVPLGAEYTIPVPEVISNETIISSTVNAYANYGTASQIDVPIIDGKIKIDKDRRYTLLYTVKNAAGCVGYETLVINPVDVDAAITLNTDYQNFTDIFSGNKVVLPEFSLDTINNPNSLNVKIKAVHEKEIIEVDKNSRTFIPSFAGKYTIIYECTDNVFTVNYEYELTCGVSNVVEFIGEISLPRYFIKNAQYTLEAVPCYSFASAEPELIDFNAYISYDNGLTFLPVADYKCVEITGSETAIIKYVCENEGSSSEIVSDPVRIVDVGYGIKNGLRIRDYFIHDNFEVKTYEETQKTDVQYDSIVKSGNNSLSFINAVDYNALDFKFKIPVNLSNYEKVNVILSDYYDESITYTISYFPNGELCYVSLNGDTAVSSDYKFVDNSVTKKLSYNSLNKQLTVNDLTFKNVDLTGLFKSSLCYIEVELEEISGDASIIIDSINLQNFRNNRKSDNGVPIISFKDFSGEYELGTIVTISIPCVTDVLSTVVNKDVTVYVAKQESEYVQVPLYSLDNVCLDGSSNAMRVYQVKLDSYGQYIVSFAATDGAGKSSSAMCFVSVVDFTAPTIKLNGSNNVTLKKGETLNLNYSVSDDMTDKKDISVSVFMRDLKTNAFYTFNENKIRFTYAGTFEVFIYAKDASGNFAYKVINVTVKG